MLVKYYGLVPDKESNTSSPRSEFIENGLFRMTQPKFLNDKGSEARLLPYLNAFSPSDYEWAKKQFKKDQRRSACEPTIQDLENLYLKPSIRRYVDYFPEKYGYSSADEYDKEQLEKTVEQLNSIAIEMLSCDIGVLSLSKSDTNENMWTHYASEGKGIAVTFNREHSFFKKYVPKDVEYTPEKRVSFTYFKGRTFLHGCPVLDFHVDDRSDPLSFWGAAVQSGLDIQSFWSGLLFTKAENWKIEDESRIVCTLHECVEKKGSLITPNLKAEIVENFKWVKNECNELNFLKIPFDAFESIVFGYSMSALDKDNIIRKIARNNELSHIKLREARHDIYGKIKVT